MTTAPEFVDEVLRLARDPTVRDDELLGEMRALFAKLSDEQRAELIAQAQALLAEQRLH